MYISITASVGNLVATTNHNENYKVFKTIQMVSNWLSSCVVLLLLFLYQDVITIWLGEQYVLDHLTVIAICINMYFSICMRPVWTFREGTGMYSKIRYIMVATAVLNLILSIVLGKAFGLAGIIFATSISKLATYFWYEPKLLFDIAFDRPVFKYYIDYLKNLVLILICLTLSLTICNKFSESSILGIILKGLLVIIITSIVYLVVYFRTEEFERARNYAKRLLVRVNRQ